MANTWFSAELDSFVLKIETPVPLTTVTTTWTSPLSRSRSRSQQTYRNTETDPLECVYGSLSTTRRYNRFRRHNRRPHPCQSLQEEDEAFQEYTEAISRGEEATFSIRVIVATNTFVLSVGRLPR
ncbi:hypothetical protein BV898_12515 [Hypsibius exemplaris]|uniref:Uncharacterized protein n=1 Tax=Hypsibius exemplaris TaxID=2072580 RepID=A0A1W0WDR7_HYPEX|nr:hypothetical protein BV898_12515 [Hypsibius exemplaris]